MELFRAVWDFEFAVLRFGVVGVPMRFPPLTTKLFKSFFNLIRFVSIGDCERMYTLLSKKVHLLLVPSV